LTTKEIFTLKSNVTSHKGGMAMTLPAVPVPLAMTTYVQWWLYLLLRHRKDIVTWIMSNLHYSDWLLPLICLLTNRPNLKN